MNQPATTANVMRLLRQGDSVRQVAAHTGLSEDKVREIARFAQERQAPQPGQPGADALAQHPSPKVRAAWATLQRHLAEWDTKGRLRSEIAALEAELAQKRQALRGSKSAPSAATPAKRIREWARANRVDCPPVGRIPRDVEAAYLAANPEQAS